MESAMFIKTSSPQNFTEYKWETTTSIKAITVLGNYGNDIIDNRKTSYKNGWLFSYYLLHCKCSAIYSE